MKLTRWQQKQENLRLKAAGSWTVFVDAVKNYGLNGDANQAAAIALYAVLSAIPLFILSIVVAGVHVRFLSGLPGIHYRSHY